MRNVKWLVAAGLAVSMTAAWSPVIQPVYGYSGYPEQLLFSAADLYQSAPVATRRATCRCLSRPRRPHHLRDSDHDGIPDRTTRQEWRRRPRPLAALSSRAPYCGALQAKFARRPGCRSPIARDLRIGAERARAHVLPCSTCAAVIEAGATPFSTQSISAVMASRRSGPTPPRQWNMPGTMNRRKKSGVPRPLAATAFR